MAGTSGHYQIGIAVFDTPRLAISTTGSLFDSGLEIDQVCIVSMHRVMMACARLAASLAEGQQRLTELFGDVRRWPNSMRGEEIVATSQPLFNAFLRSQLTEAGSIVRSQASRHSWDVERAIRSGATGVVTHPRDNREQQISTRILLANSTHKVTTYVLTLPEWSGREKLQMSA